MLVFQRTRKTLQTALVGFGRKKERPRIAAARPDVIEFDLVKVVEQVFTLGSNSEQIRK